MKLIKLIERSNLINQEFGNPIDLRAIGIICFTDKVDSSIGKKVPIFGTFSHLQPLGL